MTVHLPATFCGGAHFYAKQHLVVAMKQIVPVVLALVPLVAVISACVAVP